MTDEARFLKKKKNIRGPNFGPTDLNWAQNEVIEVKIGVPNLGQTSENWARN